MSLMNLTVNQFCALVSACSQILRQVFVFFVFFLSCLHGPECSFKIPHNAPRCPGAVAMLEQYGGVSRRMRVTQRENFSLCSIVLSFHSVSCYRKTSMFVYNAFIADIPIQRVC